MGFVRLRSGGAGDRPSSAAAAATARAERGRKVLLGRLLGNAASFWRQRWPHCSEQRLSGGVTPDLFVRLLSERFLSLERVSLVGWYMCPGWIVQNTPAKSNTSENQRNENICAAHTPMYYVFEESLAFLWSWAFRCGRESSSRWNRRDGVCGRSLALQFTLLDEYGLNWAPGFQFPVTRY